MATSFRRETHSGSGTMPIKKATGAILGMTALCFMSTFFLGLAATDPAVAFGVCVRLRPLHAAEDHLPPSGALAPGLPCAGP